MYRVHIARAVREGQNQAGLSGNIPEGGSSGERYPLLHMDKIQCVLCRGIQGRRKEHGTSADIYDRTADYAGLFPFWQRTGYFRLCCCSKGILATIQGIPS